MYIDIFPYDRSFDNTPVTYIVPAHLQADISSGILVEIPWKNSLQRAIVLNTTEEIEDLKDIKPITNILTSFPLLNTKELTEAQYLS